MARYNDLQQSHRRLLCIRRGWVSAVGGGCADGGGEDGGQRSVAKRVAEEVWDAEMGG